jgi:ABC-2 type transport system ATP-binding protein
MDQILDLVGKGVGVTKARETVLDNLNFSIQPGKITGLIGPSGSGKTTLMRSIVGVQKLSSGTLRISGWDAGDKALRRRIGYVTQTPAIYSDLTVWQNLRYFATIAGSEKTQINETMEAVRLTDKKDQLVESLSGGQRARVSLAIALLGNPDILVMDEPTVGLDPILRQELWELFGDLAKKGKIVFVSSHVMDEAERCEELLLMRNGKLLWADTKKELLKNTDTLSVEEAFIKMIKGAEK